MTQETLLILSLYILLARPQAAGALSLARGIALRDAQNIMVE